MIEVALVITILGILATMALPNFMALTDQAHTSSRNNVKSAVQTAIRLAQVQDFVINGPPGVYPNQLDALGNNTTCSAASACFGGILLNGITDGRWSKQSTTQYRYTTDQGQAFNFVYSSGLGTFIEQ